MFHKIVALTCFVNCIFMHFVLEGYPQTEVKRNVPLEEQKEGRTLLVGAATLYGLLLYGPGTASLLEIESAAQFAGLELLIGGSSFIGALQLTKNHRLGTRHYTDLIASHCDPVVDS